MYLSKEITFLFLGIIYETDRHPDSTSVNCKVVFSVAVLHCPITKHCRTAFSKDTLDKRTAVHPFLLQSSQFTFIYCVGSEWVCCGFILIFPGVQADVTPQFKNCRKLFPCQIGWHTAHSQQLHFPHCLPFFLLPLNFHKLCFKSSTS